MKPTIHCLREKNDEEKNIRFISMSVKNQPTTRKEAMMFFL